MTRQQLIRQNEQLRSRYEKAFYPLVKKSLKNQISSFTSVLKSQGTNVISSVIIIDAEMRQVIESAYVHTGVAKANQTLSYLRRLRKIEKKKGSFGYNEEWTKQIIDYFRMNLFNKVVLPISDTTKEFILKVISKGTAEGWSIDRMVQEIEREDYLDGRVRRILRTELNRAINYGSVIGEQKYEFKTQKRWVSVHDRRTRITHELADGQTVDTDGIFTVGGEQMDFPGDPNASAEETVNCRCHTEMVAVRDSDGRLIPKVEQAPVRVTGRLRQQLSGILQELIN